MISRHDLGIVARMGIREDIGEIGDLDDFFCDSVAEGGDEESEK